MKVLNIGVIGTGSRARAHLDVIPKISDRYRLAAVCDIDPQRAAQVGAETGANAYSDLEEMLERERLDVGLIAVQAEGHHAIARCLAEHKVHILTETPIALTLPCVDLMIEAAEKNGVLLEVSENVGRWPAERLKQKIVAAGLIGEVQGFHLCYRMGSYHGINAIRMITGQEVAEVAAEFVDDGETLERARIRMTGGVEGTYENRTSGGKFWEVYGTEGTLRAKEVLLAGGGGPLPIVVETSGEGERKTVERAFLATDPEVEWVNPHRQYALPGGDDVACADTLMSLYDGIVNGRPLGYDGHRARRDTEVLVAIRESATRSGEAVGLPLTGVTEYERRLHAEFERVHGVDFLEVEPRHMKLKYDLPPGLKEFLYSGRLPKEVG